MYRLLVYYPDSRAVHATIELAMAADVFDAITRTLAEHAGCEHVVVTLDHTRLFAVDCKGRRLP